MCDIYSKVKNIFEYLIRTHVATYNNNKFSSFLPKNRWKKYVSKVSRFAKLPKRLPSALEEFSS